MWYAIVGTDVENSLERRLAVRAQHLARVQALQDDGRLLLAGPFPAVESNDPGPAGFTGSLIVAEFDSLDEARAWIADDPYARTGVFARVDIKPFRKVLP
jgi:uncharacterized protein YciI